MSAWFSNTVTNISLLLLLSFFVPFFNSDYINVDAATKFFRKMCCSSNRKAMYADYTFQDVAKLGIQFYSFAILFQSLLIFAQMRTVAGWCSCNVDEYGWFQFIARSVAWLLDAIFSSTPRPLPSPKKQSYSSSV